MIDGAVLAAGTLNILHDAKPRRGEEEEEEEEEEEGGKEPASLSITRERRCHVSSIHASSPKKMLIGAHVFD